MGKGVNKSRVINAMKKAKKNYLATTDAFLIKAGFEYAKIAVEDSVYNYLESSGNAQLTGNTVAGFAAGVYYNGVLLEPVITASNIVSGLKSPTAGYARPGDTGFTDWATGEHIQPKNNRAPHVRQYKDSSGFQFLEVGRGNSIDNAQSFFHKNSPNGWSRVTVIIADCTPYAEYLSSVRGFDILETTKFNARNDLIRSLKAVNINDLDAKVEKEEKAELKTASSIAANTTEWESGWNDEHIKYVREKLLEIFAHSTLFFKK